MTGALSALASLGVLLLVAPGYLGGHGFPLDDSWIHAVYARELARSGMLAYNPGEPATGATSPLWALLLAVPHLLAGGAAAVVVATKLLGFALHVLTAWVAARAVAEPSLPGLPVHFAALLVGANPALVAASVSGMEVPLATLAGATLLLLARRGGLLAYGAVSALASLARPELGLVSLLAPLARGPREDLRGVATRAAAGLAGNLVSFGALSLRNMAVSGRPLPATFYAKVGGSRMPWWEAQAMGFSDLLGEIPPVDSMPFLAGLAVVAGVALWRGKRSAPLAAAVGYWTGLFFFAASFILIRPYDPPAFYHQRYVLPALPLVLAAMPALFAWLLERVPRPALRHAAMGGFALLALVLYALDAPPRYAHLLNDARNIDDVQVAVGRALREAAPSEVVWAVDAGAIRYFGRPYVVDMLGLNTPQLTAADGQRFLDSHRPRYIEVVPSWSALDAPDLERMPAVLFRPSTPYTVTSNPRMQDHYLVRCAPGTNGTVNVRRRIFRFACAP